MLGEFVVKVANLAEAEGRAAKRGALDAAFVVCVYVAATRIGTVGFLCLGAGVYFFLTEWLSMPRWGAWFVVGAMMLGFAAGCFWVSRRATREANDTSQPDTSGAEASEDEDQRKMEVR